MIMLVRIEKSSSSKICEAYLFGFLAFEQSSYLFSHKLDSLGVILWQAILLHQMLRRIQVFLYAATIHGQGQLSATGGTLATQR